MTNPIDDLIATAAPRLGEVTVCARGDLVASHRDLVQQLGAMVVDDDSLEATDDDAKRAIAEQIVAVEAEIEKSRVTIKLQSIGGRWSNLLREHPPSGDQRLMGYDNNPDTFQPAAIAACAVDPPITLEQATKMQIVLDEGEWGTVYTTVQHLNRARTPNPKLAAATEILHPSAPSSTTSGLEDSLEAGSSVSGAQQ